jgi:hypothetical protein
VLGRPPVLEDKHFLGEEEGVTDQSVTTTKSLQRLAFELQHQLAYTILCILPVIYMWKCLIVFDRLSVAMWRHLRL